MNDIFLIIGTNEGDRLEFINIARCLLEYFNISILKSSKIYESEAWGYSSSSFLNQVMKVSCKHQPHELLEHIQEIEADIGRDREIKQQDSYADRKIDIDILFYEDKIIETENLNIPHPRLHLRNFVLVPLFEIAPHLVHPVFKETVVQLVEKCEDKSWVKVFNK